MVHRLSQRHGVNVGAFHLLLMGDHDHPFTDVCGCHSGQTSDLLQNSGRRLLMFLSWNGKPSDVKSRLFGSVAKLWMNVLDICLEQLF